MSINRERNGPGTFEHNGIRYDYNTAQLMTRFYQLWRVEGKPPVQALAWAQKELRETEKFRHPFYWAAFYMTGV